MIFGFNTDVKAGDTVYHVQSEARTADQVLQTQVFVRGRCIGKLATSYAEHAVRPDFSDEHMHEMLKQQHKSVLGSVREGKAEEMFGAAVEPAAPAPAPAGFVLNWDNAHSVYHENNLTLRFSVADDGTGVPGARLIAKFVIENSTEPPIFSQADTDENGTAEMRIFLDEAALAEAHVMVQANHGDKVAKRKFRLRKH